MIDADPHIRFRLGLGFLLMFVVQWSLSFFLFKYRVKSEYKDLISRDHDKTGSVILGSVIRQWFFEQLRPFEETFIRWKVTPNMITTMGFTLSVITAFFFHMGWICAAGWLLCMTGSFDILDGVTARKTNKCTKSGAYFDSVLDRYGEMIVYGGLLSYYMQLGAMFLFWTVFIGLMGAQMVSYTRARAECVGVDAKIGVMQRPERMVFLGLGSVFSSYFNAMLSPWFPEKQYLLAFIVIFITFLSNLTAILRLNFTFRALQKTQS